MQLVYLFSFIMTILQISDKVEQRTILFYGDSITAGYGIGTELAFPKLIEDRLKREGYDVEVVNGGLSGETTAGGLTRIDWMLNRKYDVFILELGGNDGLRGLPVEETKKNLIEIIKKVREKNAETKIIIAGMMIPPNMGPEYSDEFKGVFEEIAGLQKTKLIPFLLEGVAGDESLNQPDGIHPNAAGHEIIARKIYPIIKSSL